MDISDIKKAEKMLKESYQKLQKIINDVINTLASIVKTGGPYTSGHQKRVASLATAISAEMGLKQRRAGCER